MPRDGTAPADQKTASAKLLELAEFMDDLDGELLDLRTVHHACGTAHCAWGWGEVIGLFPRSDSTEDDAAWALEMESAQEGHSRILGLTDAQFRYCFGMGYQFRKLDRPYTPADVARHLRETAKELDVDKVMDS
jgi:hypothetical protein